jgi:hypothetical protein
MPYLYIIRLLHADIDSSPYGSPLIAVHFGDGPPLFVHAQLIAQSPKLAASRGHSNALHLGHIPSGAGHVLVHYLFTGTYEPLGVRGSSCYKKDAAEFAISARVYGIARDYGLPGLEGLARGEMEKLSNRLPVVEVLDTLGDISPKLSIDDAWFQNYLKSLVRPLIDDPPKSLDSLSNNSGRTLSVANALLKVVVELWSEKPSSGRSDSGVCRDHQDESATPHVHAEAEPAISPPHNLTNVLTSAPGHDTTDVTPTKGKKAKKRKGGAGDGTGLPWDVSIDEDRSRIQGEKQMEAHDKLSDTASTASTTTRNMNAMALRRLNKTQESRAAGNNHDPEPMPRPPNIIGCTIDPRLLLPIN